MDADEVVPAPHPPVVVGVGASAGGLEALQGLMHGLPVGLAASLVVAQHLAAEHRSVLVDLLARETSWPVVAAEDGMALHVGTVYVAPPGHDVAVGAGGTLEVGEPDRRTGPSPSIDRLLMSVAQECGTHGVGIVLSGTGSDGAHGLRAVRAADGLTVAQDPASARFDAMPRAAIGGGVVDLVLRPQEMGPALARLVEPGPAWADERVPAEAQPTLSTVVAQLRRATGVDFSRYKESTLRRQVGRRMAIRQLGGVEDYLPVLASDPEEARALMANLLVTVTSFFRDPDAFAALAQELAGLLEGREEEPVRVWVPGCATGEEVYSLTMLVAEALGRPADLARRVKVFGTDLDETSLAVARRAVFPAAAAATVPDELRLRYLLDHGADVEVVHEVRDCVVFARHNVAEDPPFPRLDLVSCRNTLIYFTAPLQERVLGFLRYALRPGGLLFLGQSESLGTDAPGFDVLDGRHRIFSRAERPSAAPRTPGTLSAWRPEAPSPRRRPSGPREGQESRAPLLEAMLRVVAAPCLVVDADMAVIEVVGDVSAYCQVSQGAVSSEVASFLRPELRAEARHLLLQLRSGQSAAVSRPVGLSPLPPVRLQARTVDVDGAAYAVLSFLSEPGASTEDLAAVREPAFERELERLERELLTSQESLNASLEELEAANEELQASSEELQATYEELQASYEELETSNEELQATNEELGNLNQQNRLRGEELSVVNDDLVNVQSSLNQGMVIVDGDLRVTRFSPLAVRLFALVDDDIGRPLLGVPTTLKVWGLDEALAAVVSGGERRAIEVRGTGVAFMLQVLPYVATVQGRRGAIITLTDVTQMVALRQTAESALGDFRATTDALAALVWKRDTETGAVVYVSRRVEDFLGRTQEDLRRDPSLLDSAIHVDDRARVAEARTASPDGWDVEYRLLSLTGAPRWVRESARLVGGRAGGFVAGTLVDVTDRVSAEQVAAERAALLARQATHDAATGLLNREALGRELARELARAERSGGSVALVWMDLDLFKQVNDEHGHDVGDQVLAEVAGRARSVVRAQDLVGRLGGDEFGLIVTGIHGTADLETFLGRLLEAMREPMEVRGLQLRVPASLGVALGPADGLTPAALFRAADEAMYAAKGAGGDRYAYFEGAMNVRADARRSALRELTAAIEAGSFEMHYQPIVRIADGAVWGLESLVRWRRGDEVAAAGEFVPFCEETGLIRPLGLITLDDVAADVGRMARAGMADLPVTVNLSAKQLEDPECLARLRAWPGERGLAGLVVEVTESVFLPDRGRALATVHELHALGAAVAIDDFGSGYSNLSLLQRLEPAYLKLDSSFLALGDGATEHAIVRAAIDFAHALGARVIVEGLEDVGRLERVGALGAEFAQGYAIAHPMPLDDALEWLRARRSA